jgi:predicted transcriptional regulator
LTTKIIPFPTRDVRELAEIEKVLRTQLSSRTSDNDLIEHVVSRMKDYIKNYLNKNFTFELPVNMSQEQINELQRTLAEQINDMTNQIMFERLLLEIEIYQKT